MRNRLAVALLLVIGMALLASACASDQSTSTTDLSASGPEAESGMVQEEPAQEEPAQEEPVQEEPVAVETSTAEPAVEPTVPATATVVPVAATSAFMIEVWADNWMAVYVDGELIGEDSVPITTERSFNAETFAFEAAYPFTVAIEAKDFKETDSGIEYIGQGKQQMGDGGIIAQVTDTATGQVVAVTNSSWSALVVHRAPLNTECEKDADPNATCQFEITETPGGWADPSFDTTAWGLVTEWTAAEVSPKDGYDRIAWNESARLVWGADLEVDNTVLLRTTVTGR